MLRKQLSGKGNDVMTDIGYVMTDIDAGDARIHKRDHQSQGKNYTADGCKTQILKVAKRL